MISFGAKPDGKTEATQAFLKAWQSACNSAIASTIYIPKGRFLLIETVFRGPCKNRITVKIDGTLVAPSLQQTIVHLGIQGTGFCSLSLIGLRFMVALWMQMGQAFGLVGKLERVAHLVLGYVTYITYIQKIVEILSFTSVWLYVLPTAEYHVSNFYFYF